MYVCLRIAHSFAGCTIHHGVRLEATAAEAAVAAVTVLAAATAAAVAAAATAITFSRYPLECVDDEKALPDADAGIFRNFKKVLVYNLDHPAGQPFTNLILSCLF